MKPKLLQPLITIIFLLAVSSSLVSCVGDKVFLHTPVPLPGTTLSVPEGTEKAPATKNPGTKTAQAARGLKALLVLNGPEDVPGWDGEHELELADETHLVYYLPEDWMYDKAPFVYFDLMPQYGWELSGDGMVAEGNTTTMTFVKGDRTATIVISIESDRRVKVAIEIANH